MAERALLKAYGLQQAGDLPGAERLYRDILRNDAANVHALNLLGLICLQTNRCGDAEALIASALASDPRDAQAQANHGLALKDLGRLPEARAAFERSLRLDPRPARTFQSLGAVLAAEGAFSAAVAAFRESLRRDPRQPECLCNLAGALAEVGRAREAAEAARRALQLAPRLADAHLVLGDALLKCCDYAGAVQAYDAAIALDPDLADASINRATALKEAGDGEGAKVALEAAIARFPENGRAHYSLGVLLEQMGDKPHAMVRFRAAVAASPGYGAAFYQLAQLTGGRLEQDEIEAMREIVATSPSVTHQGFAAFGLARVAEAAGDPAGAMPWLAKGHTALAGGQRYDDARTAEFHGAIMAMGQLGMETVPPTGAPRPLFVLGMPRSGTTLVEQILATHPDVAGAGESSFLEDAVADAVRATGEAFPAASARLSATDRARIAATYRARLFEGHEGARFVVDKTPLNFQYIGFARLLLPDAIFLHCVRDPLETCLSIWRLPFDRSQSYAHDLKALGLFHNRYRALMAHWHRVFSGLVHDVTYEGLLDDLESEVRAMLAHVGLDFTPELLRFHETERLVRTPSSGQVRQPIYRTSRNAAARYGATLDPLRAALEA